MVGTQAGKIQVSESVSEYIQQDFVTERQANPAITSDDLIRRMGIARFVTSLAFILFRRLMEPVGNRLYALSLHHAELSVDVWERAKALDERRKARLV